ncbi:ABC transporter G family member 1-like isoform X2 [Prosopis cineraria]|uniref:ABC transporter G family member 1-like isoform X2 n=1 Tax=Prosopis cineraria TaxID=364024 RepID=UPI00240F1D41|nr:ABC transporter G family member 1-like isoform X2 [Prosopis cineraria]
MMSCFLKPDHHGSSRRGQIVSLEMEERTEIAVAEEEEGIWLTWEDLSVTVSNGKDKSKPILQGLTGYAKPGQLLAIMGPSGCGKSTFLDALAGRLCAKAKQTGDILINGHKKALAYGTSAYLTQDDSILTTLTVGEAVHYSAQLQLPDSMTKSEKKERADFSIREMGLQDVINTRIGGCGGSKGISGGQKRRVSMCIEILTRPSLLFLDEPTSGLDSAASYYVMSRIASLNEKDGVQRTIIAAIHQPSSEVFQLFHDLCLLSSGQAVYFGPASAANEEDPEQGLSEGLTTEETVNILVKSYESSAISHQVQTEVVKIRSRNSGAMELKRHASFLKQCIILTRRSFVNMYRDVGYYWLRLLVHGGLAITLGTIFYNIGSSESVQIRGSLLMFVATFLSFITICGFSSLVVDMKVFERERLNGHYGVAAYTIGHTFSCIPFLLLMSLIPGAIVYYLTGLHQGGQHFLYFASVLFISVMLVESFMMIVASMLPNFLMGMIAGAGVLGVMMLNGGFYRLPSELPRFLWRYPCYYISIHRYAYHGLFKNEFEGLTFSISEEGRPRIISGEEMLRNSWQIDVENSKWIDLLILVGMAILYRSLFIVIVKSIEKVKPIVAAFNFK